MRLKYASRSIAVLDMKLKGQSYEGISFRLVYGKINVQSTLHPCPFLK